MANNTKKTTSPVASLAGKTLQSGSASKTQRTLAGSVLSQAGTGKQTGAAVEPKASQALRSTASSGVTKTLAGSVVSQSNKKR